MNAQLILKLAFKIYFQKTKSKGNCKFGLEKELKNQNCKVTLTSTVKRDLTIEM